MKIRLTHLHKNQYKLLWVEENINLELYIFFKSQSQSKTINLEYFKYQSLENIAPSLKNGISNYETSIKGFTKQEFNPLSLEKEGKILETLELNQTTKDSKLMDIYKQIILDNRVIDYEEELDNNTYVIKKLHKINQASFPAFCYALKHLEKVYFKKTSNNSLLLKNDYHVLLRRDTAKEYEKEDLMIVDTKFDFHIDQDEILIRSSFAFEQILKYELVYEKHKKSIINNIQSADVIENFEKFEEACNKSGYYRAFRKVKEETDFKKSFSNKPFIKRLAQETNNKIRWNDKTNKVYVEDLHIKTVLHIFSGLIGIDIYNQIVTFNEKFNLPQ